MDRTKIIGFLLALIFVISPFMANADGVIIRPLPQGDWTWADEGSQQAFINYESGIEKLIVAVDIDQGNSDVVWIMPVPGSPEQVRIDVVSELPMFSGSEVISKAKIALYQEEIFHALGLSQIWTLPFGLITLVSLRSAAGGPSGPGAVGDSVSVERHIEKGGMVVETITAKTGESLYDYLIAKGLKMEQGNISVLESYIEKDYAFVVSWINPAIGQQEKGTKKGIFITFPTSKIYYPLVPTSAYGEKEIPITIRVLGHVKPKLFSEIKSYTSVEYFTKRSIFFSSGAHQARCRSDMSQLRNKLELYWQDHGRYPLSVEEFKQDIDYASEVETLESEFINFCQGGFFYSGDGNSYLMSTQIGAGNYFLIDSSGRAEETTQSTGEDFISSELRDFYQDQGEEILMGNIDYTKISINAPAELLKQDLWMREGRPLKISLALLIANFSDNFSTIFSISLYSIFSIILSWLAGGIAGLICFRDFKKYALIGIANVATLVGFILVLHVARRKGIIPVSKKPITLVFSLIFLGLTVLIWLWTKSLIG